MDKIALRKDFIPWGVKTKSKFKITEIPQSFFLSFVGPLTLAIKREIDISHSIKNFSDSFRLAKEYIMHTF